MRGLGILLRDAKARMPGYPLRRERIGAFYTTKGAAS